MNKTFTKIALSTSSILTTALMASAVHAQSLPSGGSVAADSATIDSTGTTNTTITQTSDRAVINWASFDRKQRQLSDDGTVGSCGRVIFD